MSLSTGESQWDYPDDDEEDDEDSDKDESEEEDESDDGQERHQEVSREQRPEYARPITAAAENVSQNSAATPSPVVAAPLPPSQVS